MAKQELLTAADVAERIGIGEPGVRRMAREGRIPAYQVGRLWRFDRAELEAWLRDHRNEAPRPPATRTRGR